MHGKFNCITVNFDRTRHGFIVSYMGTIVPNKEKIDLFNVIRFYDHNNLWDASNCACCKQLIRGEMSKTTATRLNVTQPLLRAPILVTSLAPTQQHYQIIFKTPRLIKFCVNRVPKHSNRKIVYDNHDRQTLITT